MPSWPTRPWNLVVNWATDVVWCRLSRQATNKWLSSGSLNRESSVEAKVDQLVEIVVGWALKPDSRWGAIQSNTVLVRYNTAKQTLAVKFR